MSAPAKNRGVLLNKTCTKCIRVIHLQRTATTTMKKLHIDPTLQSRMYSKSKYAKDFGISRATLDKRIKAGEVETILIKGATIVLAAAA